MPSLRCFLPPSRSATITCALAASAALSHAALDRPWQKISDPTAAAAAKVFAAPPPEYSAQFTWGWAGPVDQASIARDLDGMKALGVHAAAIEPKAGMKYPYLSPEYFELVRVAVEEAKKRNMRLWIMDEGDYPSGLAGGKFTLERPDLRMRALAPPERVQVASGAEFSREVPAEFVCAVATNKSDGSTLALEPKDGRIAWTAPASGDWEVTLVNWIFRTMPTRSANTTGGAKDATHSLMDFLSPEATSQFKEWTFEGYRKAIGDEFGKTVLGFRGDEPAYGFNPWTPKLLTEFQQRKGYDLRPYLAAFAGAPGPRTASLTSEQRRAYADYCDVWSDLFRDSFFNMEAAWCAEQGLEMQLHVEHEEILPQLAVANGDFFKCFRNIQVPGIDIIWHQIWMDNPADFPKLASSAAHLYGHPRAMCEAFAAYQPPPNLKQARWLLDFLMTRGINRIEYMFWSSSAARPRAATTPNPPANPTGNAAPRGGVRYYREPGFPDVAAYVNRATYLLGEGRPAADIGLYLPSSSFWLADAATSQQLNKEVLALAHALVEHQRDFDFVDEQALTSVLVSKGNRLVNLSGQGYRAIIVPHSLVISRAALERLRTFAAAGGKVIFLGEPPAVAEKSFLHATTPADVSWASLHQKDPALTPAVLAKLPAADFALDATAPKVSYTHRQLRDADVYFIFNSADEKLATRARLSCVGKVEVWDSSTGKISPLPNAQAEGGSTSVPLELEPWSTTLLVLNRGASSP